MAGNMVSVILVNYNGEGYLRKCLRSIDDHAEGVPYEVVVVDNASTDGSREIIRREFPDVTLIESDDNSGFSRGNSLGAQNASGKYLLFLNTDAYFIENSMKVLAGYMEEHATVAAVGPVLVFEDGRFQLSAGKLPNVWVEFTDKIVYTLDRQGRGTLSGIFRWLFRHTQRTGWITGACMMVRRSAFEQIGGFDEKMFMYYEDKDICKRIAEAGWQVVYYTGTTVVHLLGGSAASLQHGLVNRRYRTSQVYYYQKHLGAFQTALLQAYLRLTGKA
ncbi:MAG: glycosyltransferase family 2 protein [Bacteroidota bacterium]